MRYFVHIIDDSSQHQKTDSNFNIVSGLDHENKKCDILRSDIFYCIEAESPQDAVMSISDIIKVKVNGEEKLLSEALVETKKSTNTVDFNNSKPEFILCDNDREYSYNPYYQISRTTCQIEQGSGDDKWFDLHNIMFFVVREDKIVEIEK